MALTLLVSEAWNASRILVNRSGFFRGTYNPRDFPSTGEMESTLGAHRTLKEMRTGLAQEIGISTLQMFAKSPARIQRRRMSLAEQHPVQAFEESKNTVHKRLEKLSAVGATALSA